MIKIRLARYGTKNKFVYRIVAADSHKKGVGKTLDTLGFWNPVKNIKQVDKNKMSFWIKRGALINKSIINLI